MATEHTIELLRWTTCGSVDDGKSTLIGRLLYDSGLIPHDQLEAIRSASERKGKAFDLSLLTDGLKLERELGITIDVAYRYFTTAERKFIVSDAPGHFEFTKNMIAATADVDVAIILVDARNGIVEQTRRHVFLAAMLRIPQLVLCINKLDLVGYDKSVYESIFNDFKELTSLIRPGETQVIPISAFEGDNIVHRSSKISWYDGPTLLYYLEHVKINNENHLADARLPVQCMIENQVKGSRLIAGQIAGGVFRTGDAVKSLPSGLVSTIKSINVSDRTVEEAFAPMSVTLELMDELQAGRGEMIVPCNMPARLGSEIELMICWFSDKDLRPGRFLVLQYINGETGCEIISIDYKIDISTFSNSGSGEVVNMNDIACVRVRTDTPFAYDPFSQNRKTGSVLFIDEISKETVGLGMIVG